MKNFYKNVQGWAVERGIIANGTLQGQALKLVEEFGELAAGIARGDKETIKDAIGDCAVVLTIMSDIDDDGVGDDFDVREIEDNDDCDHFGCTLEYMAYVAQQGLLDKHSYFASTEAECVIEGLMKEAKKHGLTFDECLSHAWNQIKDRKGHMNAQGVFVKEEV